MLNSKGSSLIFIVSMAIILNIVFITVYMTITKTQKASGEKRLQTSAISLAEAGKEKLYGEITLKTFTPTALTKVTVYSDHQMSSGSFTVKCSSNTAIDTVWIESIGKDKTSQIGIAVVAAVTPAVIVNTPPVRGAVTARSDVNVSGNITLDGRDHDTAFNVVDNGLFGVSTCTNLNFTSGSAQVGGGGQAPVDRSDTTGLTNTISEQKVPPTALLSTPEAFLGLPAGALNEFQSSTLTTPFHGIAYITNSIGPVHFDNSSGILIVHNAFKTAELTINDGTFTGLIIADMVGTVNGKADILGGVVTISETDMSTFGNGSANIMYSSYVMNNLGRYCTNVKKRVTELSWKEFKIK